METPRGGRPRGAPTPRSPVQSRVVLSTATFRCTTGSLYPFTFLFSRVGAVFECAFAWNCPAVLRQTRSAPPFCVSNSCPRGGCHPLHPAGGSLEIFCWKGGSFAGTFYPGHASYVWLENTLFPHLNKPLRILPHCNYHPPLSRSIILDGHFSRVSGPAARIKRRM